MEYLLSAGIDIGTTTTHLVISRIGIAVERGWGTVPKAEIKKNSIPKSHLLYPAGMAPVEAGAYIADVIQDLLQKGGK